MPDRGKTLISQGLSQVLLASAMGSKDARKQGRRDARVLERRALQASDWDRPRQESGAAAWLALRALESELETRASAIAQEVSSAEWLFFLRRAPWLFAGYEQLGSGYLISIAESISALSQKAPKDSEAALPLVAYAFEPALIGSLHRLGGASYLLGNIQNMLRCAGKGSTIKSRMNGFPIKLADPKLDVMTALWDSRMRDSGFDFLSQAGQYSHKLHVAPQSTDPGVVPLTTRSRKGTFGLSPLPMGALPSLNDPALPADLRFPTDALDLVAFLISASLFRMVKNDDTRQQIEQFEQSGLRFVVREQARAELELVREMLMTHRFGLGIPDGLDLGAPDEILSRLVSGEVSVWPPSMGPAVREAADGVLVEDLWGATLRLQRALARPAEMAGGKYANAWSTHFESVIQGAIDATAWKPSPTTAEYRRRHLRIGGQRIGEIDAIGEQPNRLLLVSCKCIPFSEEWRKGEHSAVRNVASSVDEAVARWADLVGNLRAAPHGDNYDFSAFSELIGVVVLPSLPWTPTEASVVEVVPGLRAVVNAYELDRWINTGR
jgi:hypothetical protein